MANFQNKVNLVPAIGLPGAYAAVNPIVSTAKGYIAKVNVPVGGFCWEDSTDAGQVNPSGSGAPLGFVVREVAYTMCNTDAINYVPAGGNVSVQKRGDFFVQPAASVTKGQKVFASTTNGSVKGGSAGATVSGHVETDFEFVTSAAAGEIAIISNWGTHNVVASADLTDYQTKAEADAAYVSAVAAGTTAHTIKVTKNGEDSTVAIPQE